MTDQEFEERTKTRAEETKAVSEAERTMSPSAWPLAPLRTITRSVESST